jgi:hypothetical protein
MPSILFWRGHCHSGAFLVHEDFDEDVFRANKPCLRKRSESSAELGICGDHFRKDAVRINDDAAAHGTENGGIDTLFAKTISDFGCTAGTLHRLDTADQHLKLVANQGIAEALMPIIQSIPMGKGIAGVAAERKEPVEMCNLQTNTSGVAKPGAKQSQVQGTLVVPVLDG